MDTKTKSILNEVITKVNNFVGRPNNGLGKNRLSYDDVQSLLSKYDYLIESYGNGDYSRVKQFVRESRPLSVSEKFVNETFDSLPKEIRDSLTGKGGVGSVGRKQQFLGYLKSDGTITTDRNDDDIVDINRGSVGNKARGRFVWRVILEQGGIDPYTGLELDFNSIDLEHVIAFDNTDNGQPTTEDYLSREHDDNIIICNTNINQMKNNLSMKDFLNDRVIPYKNKSKQEFDIVDEIYETANTLSDSTKEKAKKLDVSMFNYDSLVNLFQSEDSKIQKIKQNARNVIDNPKDKQKISTLKSWLGKEIIQSMGLGRGLQHHSARRSVKLTSDNIYRGYLLSMVENIDNLDLYKEEWETARKIGNDYALSNKKSGQPVMLEYLKNKNLISNKVLFDSKLSKVWNNIK